MSRSLLLSAIDGHAKARPKDVAVRVGDTIYTWEELRQRSLELGCHLQKMGTVAGDRVAILSGPSFDYVACIIGIARIGAVCAPISLMLTPATIDVLLIDASPSVVLLDEAGRNLLDCESKGWSQVEMRTVQSCEFDAAIQLTAEGVSEDRAMSLIYSSGTTGTPKGILHSRRARDLYGAVFALEYGINSSSRTLLATAMYSNGTWMMLLPTLFAGGELVIVPNVKTHDLPDVIRDLEISHTFLVPTQLDQIYSEGPRQLSNSQFLTIVSAGSYLPLETKKRIAVSPLTNLFELYGNTEGVCSILRPHQQRVAFDSVGTAITTGELGIIGDGTGEIVGRSPLQSMGYYQRPDLDQELFWTGTDGNVYVRSGDLGEINNEGYLTIKGRIKDMIVSGGINVYPSDIEEVLRDHSVVADVAVVGVPHPKWGEVPLAFVQLNASVSVLPDEILDWANERLNKHQRLSDVVFLNEFPRNALGKVIKSELVDRLEEVVQ